MKFRPSRNKGVLLVLAIGMMVLVEFLTIHQLEGIKITFNLRRQFDYQQIADLAARSGLDYGYSMIKNTMEAMSLVDVRFATHMHTANSARVAEVPPSWQEILNPIFDLTARGAFPTNQASWIGTDSYDQGIDNVTGGPVNPIDYGDAIIGNSGDSLRSINSFSLKLENALAGNRAEGFGLTSEPTQGSEYLSECAEEQLDTDGVAPLSPTTFTFFDSSFSNTECLRQSQVSIYNTVWTNIPAASGTDGINPQTESRQYSNIRDGHFGTKRWHYYDQWNYSAVGGENIASDIASSNPRGTGGVIRYDPSNLAQFANHRDILFERLFHYRRDDTNLQFPYEPLRTSGASTEIDTPQERDATNNAYHVQMHTSLNLDGLDTATPSDEDLFNHEDFSNIKYKVFFKLWVTRDEKRDGYGGNLTVNPGRVTKAFITHNQPNSGNDNLLNWAGTNITSDSEYQTSEDVAHDLHPIWSIPRQNGTVYNNSSVNVVNSSYWRPNYLVDFLDTDAPNGVSRSSASETGHRLGVLQFPVPYLAYQRADKDYWDSSVRGTINTTSKGDDGITLGHKDYTRFTLWSLGTVREVGEDFLHLDFDEADQKISHFEIVSRALYKLVFYMDTRAVEVNNESQYRSGTDEDLKLLSGACSGNQNLNNTAAFNALYIPACDVHPTGDVAQLYEPLGIYLESTEKVDYLDSRK
ncbi:hypothetical protein HOF92_01150 [bacterium]|jgi:hypothetical protein|nr:hypothetical protein [bacterium]